MPRLAYLLFAALVACGTDSEPRPDDEEPMDMPTNPGDPMEPPPPEEEPEPAKTDCDEAKEHSDFTWIQDNILTPSCATSRCHDADEPEVDLDLSIGESYANLVNKGASTASGWTRVVPGSLEQSYLVVSLGRAPGPMPRDGFMPLNAPALCVEKLEAIERWILAGAPND